MSRKTDVIEDLIDLRDCKLMQKLVVELPEGIIDARIRCNFVLAQAIDEKSDDAEAMVAFMERMPDLFLDHLLAEVYKAIEDRGRDPRPPDWIRRRLENDAELKSREALKTH